MKCLSMRLYATVHIHFTLCSTAWKALIPRQAVIVYVEDEADIAECIRFVTSHKLDVAVCAGGHALKGTSSSDDFVIGTPSHLD